MEEGCWDHVLISSFIQLPGGPSKKDAAQITFLPSMANLEGGLVISNRHSTTHPFNSL